MDDQQTIAVEPVIVESPLQIVEAKNGATYVSPEYLAQLKEAEVAAVSDTESAPTAETKTSETATPAKVDESSKPESPQIDYDTILKEKTGGKFEKWDDLLQKIDAPPPEPKPFEFKNETSKLVFEYMQEGKTDELATILNQQKFLASADKLPPEDKVKARMQIENPDYTVEDIEDEYNLKYAVPENADQTVKRRMERALNRDAKEAGEYLSKLRQEIVLPELTKPPVDSPAESPYAAKEKELMELSNQFAGSLNDTLPKFNELDFSINDEDVKFENRFQITEAEKKATGAIAQDFWKDYQDRYYKDGKYDTTQMLKDTYIRNNFQKILKASVTKAMNQAKLDKVQSIANVNLDPAAAVANDWTKDATRQSVLNFLRS